VGNVTVGRDVTVEELQGLYEAVVFATGAPHDRALGIPGEDLANVFGSAAFVGWYNGHPQFADLGPDFSGRHAVVIGMGNVALDVARILAKTEAEFAGSDIVNHALGALRGSDIGTVTIVGRRGPHQIMMTPKELGELMHLERATPRVDPADLPEIGADAILEPGLRKSVSHLRSFAAIPESERADKSMEIDFDMFASPVRLVGEGRVTGVEVERTTVEAGRAVGTGQTYIIPADLVVACSGTESADGPLLGAGLLAGARAGTTAMLPVLDLSLAGDVDPAASRLLGIDLIDLEEIGAHAPAEQAAAVLAARDLVARGVDTYLHLEQGRAATPAVTAMRAHVTQFIEREIESANRRYDAATAAAVARSLRRVSNALLHTPSLRAAELARSGELADYSHALQTLFGIEVEADA
jgi:hypothetical protein